MKRVDASDLKSDFDSWPELSRYAWQETIVPVLKESMKEHIESILFAGMGGSGITGEIVSDFALETESSLRIDVLKDYHIPSWATKNTLVIAVSCSGNTEETIAALQEASKRGLAGCTFGSGGLIEKFSKNHNEFRFVRTKMLKVPRSSLPLVFFAVLKFLFQNNFLKMQESDVREALSSLSEAQKDSGGRKNQAHLVAEKIALGPCVPLTYSSRRTRAVGLRCRQSLNENAKMHAFSGVLPELCHNEIVGWDSMNSRIGKSELGTDAIDYVPVFLRLDDDPREIRTRFDIMKEIMIQRSSVEPIEAAFYGSSYLSKILSMLYFLDYVTLYTAILRHIDPIRTSSIDELKTKLKSRLNYLKNIE